ncbi:hypothetical protein J6590_099785 [Homalodisca vitripennis]|nr:hypothetical protein J6590_099785 [Homalodisca vitripennis]
MTVVVNDESKHSIFSRINIVICFIPCGGPTVICFIPCGSRAADPLDGHRNDKKLIAFSPKKTFALVFAVIGFSGYLASSKVEFDAVREWCSLIINDKLHVKL